MKSLALLEKELTYLGSDGLPMADETSRAKIMDSLKTNLDALYAKRTDVVVARDLLWYPVEGHPEICVAPDIMLAFDRPKGDRDSYQQWREGGIAPQVVIEITTYGGRLGKLWRNLELCDDYGVEEFYIYDAHYDEFSGRYRTPGTNRFHSIDSIESWISPRLGIRLEPSIAKNPHEQPLQ